MRLLPAGTSVAVNDVAAAASAAAGRGDGWGERLGRGSQARAFGVVPHGGVALGGVTFGGNALGGDFLGGDAFSARRLLLGSFPGRQSAGKVHRRRWDKEGVGIEPQPVSASSVSSGVSAGASVVALRA